MKTFQCYSNFLLPDFHDFKPENLVYCNVLKFILTATSYSLSHIKGKKFFFFKGVVGEFGPI